MKLEVTKLENSTSKTMGDVQIKELLNSVKDLKKELDEALISYWFKNDLRSKLDHLKKEIDLLEKSKKDLVQAKVDFTARK